MSRDGDERPDVLEFGNVRSRPKWVAPLLIVALVVVAAVVAWRTGHSETKPPVVAPSSAPASVIAVPTEPSTGTITREEIGRPLLGVTAGWELFGWGPQALVRIELARGRITRTTVEPPGSSGPVSFVVGRDWAVVRPLDVLPGTVVTDEQLPRRAAGALGGSGPAFPGPDPDHLWAPVAGDDNAMSLVGPDGAPTGTKVALPASAGAEPDGTGYLLVRSTGGVYLDRPDGLRRVTTGDVLAAGPSRWLTLECDDLHRCVATVIDRATGARRALTGLAVQPSGTTGLISPDGAVAAAYENDPNGRIRLHLIQLATGDDKQLDVALGQYPDQGSMVWSPDSRWLFVAGGGGRLFPIEAATGTAVDLGVPLPQVSLVAMRQK